MVAAAQEKRKAPWIASRYLPLTEQMPTPFYRKHESYNYDDEDDRAAPSYIEDENEDEALDRRIRSE